MIKNKISNVKIGSDPEFFLKEKNSNRHVSAIGMVGGSKDNPIPISGEGHGLQEDNVAIEATFPACETKEQLIDNVNFIKDYIRTVIAEPRGLELSFSPAEHFTPEELSHPQAMQLGCSPDFNAYLQDVNPSPNGNTTLRTTAAHIHIGYDNPDSETSVEIVKAFDLFLTIPSIIINKDNRDKELERRNLYGKAGAFRFKDYGVECRCLTNFWLKDEQMITWVYDQIQLMINWLNDGNIVNEELGRKIVECINTQNVELAQEIINQYNLVCVE